MDPVITARVPLGVRDRGLEVLREIGSTTSELVNTAFAYVIQERVLPKPTTCFPVAPERRELDDRQRNELAAFMRDVRIATPRTWESTPFEQLFDEAVGGRGLSIGDGV